MGRTFYFMFASIAIEMVAGISVALLLNTEFHGRGILRTLILIPWALPITIDAIMWKWIFNPSYGALNSLLYQLGLISAYRAWLSDPDQRSACRHPRRCVESYPVGDITQPGRASNHPSRAVRSGRDRWRFALCVFLAGHAAPFDADLIDRPGRPHHGCLQSFRHHLYHDLRRSIRRHQTDCLLHLPGGIFLYAPGNAPCRSKPMAVRCRASSCVRQTSSTA